VPERCSSVIASNSLQRASHGAEIMPIDIATQSIRPHRRRRRHTVRVRLCRPRTVRANNTNLSLRALHTSDRCKLGATMLCYSVAYVCDLTAAPIMPVSSRLARFPMAAHSIHPSTTRTPVASDCRACTDWSRTRSRKIMVAGATPLRLGPDAHATLVPTRGPSLTQGHVTRLSPQS